MLNEAIIGPSMEKPEEKGIKKILDYFKKEKGGINLPQLSENERTARNIMDKLKTDTAIIGWYCLLGQYDSYYAYRVKNDLLIKYQLTFDKAGLILLPREIHLFNEDSVIDTWDEEWSRFSRLYVDNDNLNNQRVCITNVTEDEIRNGLNKSGMFYISEDRLLKKPTSDCHR